MKKTPNFKSFLKKYWWLILGLCLLLFIPLGVFCCVFRQQLNDVSAWASMIAGIFTYLGSSLLAVFVFYHSWLQTNISDSLDEIDVIIDIDLEQENNHFVPFQIDSLDLKNKSRFYKTFNNRYTNEPKNYIGIKIKNNNYYTTIRIELEGVYWLTENGTFEKCAEVEIITESSLLMAFDYGNVFDAYYGISSKLLARDYYLNRKHVNFVFVFKIANAKGAIKYYVEDFGIGSSVLFMPRSLSEQQYNENIEKFGIPVDVTHFNKQFLRKKRD